MAIQRIPFFNRFITVIADNYHNPMLNRAEVASRLFVSERQLNRKLAEQAPDNFSTTLKKYRLDRALDLISHYSTVADLSEAVGFSSVSYFSACFKARYGMTVREYQRHCVDAPLLAA